ncbi:unnamed protein product [marine sediment metagenome]|uniref:Uncharacterized protein n=1 Tax=marine sediment metagenome TaxID=412755 RepID=X1AF51_9ZZZZ
MATIRLGTSIVLSPAGAIIPTAAGVEQKQIEGTNHSYYVLAFDKDTTEIACWQFLMPFSYDEGNVKVQIYWVATVTAGAVIFDVSPGHAGDSDSCDPVLPPYVCATVTVDGTSRDINISSCTLVTPFNAGEYAIVRIRRVAGAGGDTMAGDAEIIAVILQWV